MALAKPEGCIYSSNRRFVSFCSVKQSARCNRNDRIVSLLQRRLFLRVGSDRRSKQFEKALQ